MIRPPGDAGVAFSERTDGDLRGDHEARSRFARELGIPDHWAVIKQVHGSDVKRVDEPGDSGEADAMWTTEPGLPIAVFTADCFGVVLTADDAVGVAHAGWRGAAGGVVENLYDAMTSAGRRVRRAAIGPGIGPCCFEVGPEVADRFATHIEHTSWGTVSIDLVGSIAAQIEGLETWTADACTLHDQRWFSHRRDATPHRLAAVGWI